MPQLIQFFSAAWTTIFKNQAFYQMHFLNKTLFSSVNTTLKNGNLMKGNKV